MQYAEDVRGDVQPTVFNELERELDELANEIKRLEQRLENVLIPELAEPSEGIKLEVGPRSPLRVRVARLRELRQRLGSVTDRLDL